MSPVTFYLIWKGQELWIYDLNVRSIIKDRKGNHANRTLTLKNEGKFLPVQRSPLFAALGILYSSAIKCSRIRMTFLSSSFLSKLNFFILIHKTVESKKDVLFITHDCITQKFKRSKHCTYPTTAWDVHQQQTVSHKKMQNKQISLCVRVVLAPERSSASCS